jgi:hypothetical protein
MDKDILDEGWRACERSGGRKPFVEIALDQFAHEPELQLTYGMIALGHLNAIEQERRGRV